MSLEAGGHSRKAKADREEEQPGEEVGFRRIAVPFRVGDRELHDAEQVEHADHENERRIFQHLDEGADDIGQGSAQRLRQHDEPEAVPIAQPKRPRRFGLPGGDGAQRPRMTSAI